jgi:hypothetical protein
MSAGGKDESLVAACDPELFSPRSGDAANLVTRSRAQVGLGSDGAGARKHRVQAVIGGGMEMCEFAVDQERLWWAGRFARCQHERSRARNRDAAGLLDDAGKREHTTCQLVYPVRVGRLLIELRVRVGRRRARAIASAERERRRHRRILVAFVELTLFNGYVN